MFKDIRKITEAYKKQKVDLPLNHRERFKNKLATLPKKHPKNNKIRALAIAAAAIILMVLGLVLKYTTQDKVEEIPVEMLDLATVSPELKQLETNYLTAINYEMLGIQPNEQNKALLDFYFQRIGHLASEYDTLTEAVITQEISEELIDKLIDNLKQRLQLLLELKEKLKEQQNENITTQNV
ncbi:MAG: hypothetical protein CR985_02785 [Flavobacteriales bacterium]|nr:MAG: hypothetical protein CR985_02785 [Flavobacteriales bacterium]